MTESRAGTTARSDTIALELALPTNHAGQPLGFGDARIVDIARLLRRSSLVVGILALLLTALFGGIIHRERSRSVAQTAVSKRMRPFGRFGRWTEEEEEECRRGDRSTVADDLCQVPGRR
jgi:hypothetical protein